MQVADGEAVQATANPEVAVAANLKSAEPYVYELGAPVIETVWV